MENSTATARGDAGGPAPVVFALSDLWRRLAALPDQRKRRGERYAPPVLLLLIVLAKLSGGDRPSGIADWVAHPRGRGGRGPGGGPPPAPPPHTTPRAPPPPAASPPP